MAKHTLKHGGTPQDFYKYVWPFYNIMYERVNEKNFDNFGFFFPAK